MRYWLLCRALVAEGHEVVLWSSDFHHVTKSRRQLEPVYEADGFQIRLIPTRSYGTNIGLQRVLSHRQYTRRWWSLAHAAVAAGELQPPEGVVVSLPPLGLFRAAARMRHQWGCPVVVDIQDAWPETYYRLLPQGLRWLAPFLFWSARRLARQAYRQADGVTAIVNGLKGETQSLLDQYDAGVSYETGSAASLAAAVKRYAGDRDLLARHRRAARRLAEVEFDAARIYPSMARWLAERIAIPNGANREN